jgi:GNAT superfamily N-acetyltransferase
MTSITELSSQEIIKYNKKHPIIKFYDYIAYPDWFKLKMRPIFEQHRKENDGFVFMMVDPFQNNKPLGSIYCELKPKHMSKGKQIPIFGWLHADNREIATELLNHVENFAREHGHKEIRGPLNMPKMFGWGAQVEYFDCPMYWETPHNKPEIPKWIESCGYEPDTEYITLGLTHLKEVENPYPELEIISYPIEDIFANKEMMGKLQQLIERNFSGFLPDISTNKERFGTTGELLMRTGHGQDFYILAIEKETKDLVGFILEVPNIFEQWAGGKIKNTVADTVIVDEKYRGADFFFFLFNTIYKRLSRRGINGIVSGLIWSKNIPAVKTFSKIGRQIQRTVVFQKAL